MKVCFVGQPGVRKSTVTSHVGFALALPSYDLSNSLDPRFSKKTVKAIAEDAASHLPPSCFTCFGCLDPEFLRRIGLVPVQLFLEKDAYLDRVTKRNVARPSKHKEHAVEPFAWLCDFAVDATSLEGVCAEVISLFPEMFSHTSPNHVYRRLCFLDRLAASRSHADHDAHFSSEGIPLIPVRVWDPEKEWIWHGYERIAIKSKEATRVQS